MNYSNSTCSRLLKKTEGHYCIAFGITGAAFNLSLKETLYAFYYNVVSAFVTNSVKLVPLSQQTNNYYLNYYH